MNEQDAKNTEGQELTVEQKLAALEKENRELHSLLRQQEDNTSIPLDAYIEVMSLVPYKLNLSTERLGKGRQFSFSRFGEIKRILYNDLASIFENYRTFMEQGLFYILNPKVIRKHGLDDIYEKILTKEMIEKVLNFDSKAAISLYETATDAQKEVIDSMLIKKIKDGETSDIDFNVVAKISSIGGRDIVKIANELKEMEKLPQ